jgi:hypothetical protein
VSHSPITPERFLPPIELLHGVQLRVRPLAKIPHAFMVAQAEWALGLPLADDRRRAYVAVLNQDSTVRETTVATKWSNVSGSLDHEPTRDRALCAARVNGR